MSTLFSLFLFFSTFFAKKKAADKRLDSHSGIVVHRRPSHINFDVTVPTYRIASVGFTMALFQPDQSPVAIFFRVIQLYSFFVTYLPIPRGLVPLVRSSPSGRVFSHNLGNRLDSASWANIPCHSVLIPPCHYRMMAVRTFRLVRCAAVYLHNKYPPCPYSTNALVLSDFVCVVGTSPTQKRDFIRTYLTSYGNGAFAL